MSLDDMQSDSCPTICDFCASQAMADGPTILGWQLLVMTCNMCKGDFCQHLASELRPGLCGDCSSKMSEKREDN